MPARSSTAAAIIRRLACNRGSVARTAEANLGSTASDRSICSNSRCSCSESGTALLPGREADPVWIDKSVTAARRLLSRKFTRASHGRKAGRWSGCAVFLSSGRPGGPGILLSWRRSTVSVDAEAVLEQTRRAHDIRTEPGRGGVGGPLGLSPAVVPLTQRELPRCPVGRGQAFDPHSEKANPHARPRRL